MKTLVTGGNGFIGTYLIRELLSKGHEVISADLIGGNNGHNVEDVEYRTLDISSENQVNQIIQEIRPDTVFHLASQPSQPLSWVEPGKTFTTNVLGTIYLLESIRKLRKNIPTVVATSGSSYGDFVSYPTNEESVLKPLSPLAVSKATQDMLVYQYFRSFDLPTYSLRIFSTTGPGKTGDAVNDFASQIVSAEQTGETVKVGNLEPMRDISDVRDVVKAFSIVAENGVPGQSYNVGSGKQYKIKDLLLELIGFANGEVKYTVDRKKIRPSECFIIVADIAKIKSIGYRPKMSMSKTLRDVMNYWREHFYGNSELLVSLGKGSYQKGGPIISID